MTVTVPATTLAVATSTQATATLRDATGHLLTGRVVTWSSSSPAIASVTNVGHVVAVASGNVTITATSEGKSGAVQLSIVQAAVSTVTLAATPVTIAPGQATTVSATLRDSFGNVLTGRTISWQSSAPAVATVDNAGRVTGVAAGTASVSASSEGKSGAIQITVVPPTVATVEVSPATLAMVPGQSAPLVAVARDAQQGVIAGRAVQWQSTNPAVASVSVVGEVTALTAGTVEIRASIDGVLGHAVVQVTNTPVSYITISPISVSLPVGDITVLLATPRDVNSNPLTGRAVTWSTSNAAVVDGFTSDERAVITGLSVGLATVTARSEGKSASVVVSVTSPPILGVCAQIAGSLIYSDDGYYLGRLTNRFDPESAFNIYGQYGSQYGAYSTNNRYGSFGSPYGSRSAWNPYTSTPPILYKNNVAIAYYTVNSLKSPRVSPAFAATCNFP